MAKLMRKTVILVAGGKGVRMGGDLPKQFIPVDGKPILMHTAEVFYQWDSLAGLFIVIPEDHAGYWQMLCKELNFNIPHRLVFGGETRFHSVRNALQAIENAGTHIIGGIDSCNVDDVGLLADPGSALIAVHDGVRPYVSTEVITACFHAAEKYGAAIPVTPMIESVREITGAENRPFDRTRLRIVQTPQVFRADILQKAYKQPYNERFTDDASVVETFGQKIHLVEGAPENIKITTIDQLKTKNLKNNSC